MVAREKAVKERKALLSSYLMLAKTAIEQAYAGARQPRDPPAGDRDHVPLRYGSDGCSSSTTTREHRAAADPPRDGGRIAGRTRDAKGTFPDPGIIKSRRGRETAEYWTNKRPSAGMPLSSLLQILVLDKIGGWVRVSTSRRYYRQQKGGPAQRKAREETMHASCKAAQLLILVILG